MLRFAAIAALLIGVLRPSVCCAQEQATRPATPLPVVAKQLSSYVVTVRITHRGGPQKVTVCTGIAVDTDLVVTSCFASKDDKIRLTIPGGSQAVARLRVIDDYSGLALLSTSTKLTPTKLAKEEPAVGEMVLSAAAWGPESPVVTYGMVSGVQRRLQNVSYPPLLQCDVRTTKTSSGALVSDRQGRLLGIVTLVEREKERAGFTYAIPVKHVRRLLSIKRDPKELVVVQRRRPVVGMSLSGNRDQIKIVRLTDKGPASTAGMKLGDQVLAVDGIKIRSVYQALQPVIYKQPGEVVSYLLQRGSETVEARVQLAGGAVLPNANFEQLSRFVIPKIGITKPLLPPKPRKGVANVDAKDNDPQVAPVTATEKIELLQKALDRYRQVITLMQGSLTKERRDRADLEAQVNKLEKQLKQLRK